MGRVYYIVIKYLVVKKKKTILYIYKIIFETII